MIQRPAHPVRNVVDSSAWLEYMMNGSNADVFAPAIEATDDLVVPTISITEVFRWVLRERGESDALQLTAVMQQGLVVDLDAHLAASAAREGLMHKLPLADSSSWRPHGATTPFYGRRTWILREFRTSSTTPS